MKYFFLIFLYSDLLFSGAFVRHRFKIVSHDEKRAVVMFKGVKKKIYFSDISQEDVQKISSSIGKEIEIGINETRLK